MLIDSIVDQLIASRVPVVVVISVLTLLLGFAASRLEVRTVFEDLLPRDHSYVQIHEQFRETFGGSNVVTIMLTTPEEDIFNVPFLERLQRVTLELREVPGVNSFQIISLASNHLKEVRATTFGIDTRPLMWPDLPQTEEDLEALRDAVLGNPLVYGPYVSLDLRSALITVDFFDHLIDYPMVFNRVRSLVERVAGDELEFAIVGDPILYGWVNYYLPETLQLALIVVIVLAALLFLIMGTWRGTFFPLLAGAISATWGLGVAGLLGLHFDPLVVVVALLLFARAISHSLQLIIRFQDEFESGSPTTIDAAHRTLRGMFRPGNLGLATDIGCVAVVALTPIPLLEKLVVIGVVWLATILVSAIVLTPVLLSWCRDPNARAHPLNFDIMAHWLLDRCFRLVTRGARYPLVIVAFAVFVFSGWYATNLSIGDANPGSPILWPDSQYNRDAARINESFSGADRMFVVVGDEANDTLKLPEVLDHILGFQRFMEVQPQVGATMSIADIVPAVNRSLAEGNPRFEELGNSQDMNGALMFIYQQDAAPGDMERFVDENFQHGAIHIFFRDRQGDTIRTAIARINEYLDDNPLKKATYWLAGGAVGLIAAVNEVILAGQIQSIALALLILVILCTVVYRSSVAGLLFMTPVVLANTLTFSFMAWQGIGMNINTVPVAALGIGLGVDYSLYIVDRIKEEYARGHDLVSAIERSLHTAGKAVLITAATLMAAVLLWSFSSLRFQAEMGTLLALWLFVSAASALFIMPAMVYIFRPDFVLTGDTMVVEESTGATSAA